ncbi:hypothetical protein [Bradyrhizobium sp. MOS002]|uniref:hypothetical protein n=1 Tax=Bradyrhizobium sp. MOS002 TaxID=2133947 RepID=UPI000D12917B|nr:hypothetical protein [Bradyrhizobium sp. MOS002]PSO22733.1 hypothetical protein C7G41_33995 [Bradyrhizobium sp. MOS002]
MFTALRSIADVSLGYKSLQNDFFYLNKATISTYGIEKKYLIPMIMLKDLDTSTYEQSPTPSLWLFACRDKRGDLRGTGAWRYIEAMADRSAAEKKQTGKNLTIKEALRSAERRYMVRAEGKARVSPHLAPQSAQHCLCAVCDGQADVGRPAPQ